MIIDCDFRATIIQQQNSKVAHANTGSVALPAVLRAGDSGQAQFSTGSLQKAQYSHISLQAHSGHVSPSVSVPCMRFSCFSFGFLWCPAGTTIIHFVLDCIETSLGWVALFFVICFVILEILLNLFSYWIEAEIAHAIPASIEWKKSFFVKKYASRKLFSFHYLATYDNLFDTQFI